MHDAEREQCRIIVHERNDQRDRGIDEARDAEHAAQAEHGREPRHRGRDEDLRADAGGGEPGALVERERERAAQVRQADRGQAAVEIGEERAEQHRRHRKQRLRGDAAARERSATGIVIFRHCRPSCRCW